MSRNAPNDGGHGLHAATGVASSRRHPRTRGEGTATRSELPRTDAYGGEHHKSLTCRADRRRMAANPEHVPEVKNRAVGTPVRHPQPNHVRNAGAGEPAVG